MLQCSQLLHRLDTVVYGDDDATCDVLAFDITNVGIAQPARDSIAAASHASQATGTLEAAWQAMALLQTVPGGRASPAAVAV